MTEHPVITRRRAEQEALVQLAARYVDDVPEAAGMLAAAVFGSVARGDFNVWSDVDLVVVARDLPERVFDRYDVLGDPPPRVQVVPWTPDEWRAQAARRNPIAIEAIERGVWLHGAPRHLEAGS